MWLKSICAMVLYFGMLNAAAAAGDHIKATARIMSINELSPQDRLEGACDEAGQLRDNLRGKKIGKDAASNLSVLYDFVCGSSYKPVPAKPQP